VNSLLKSLLIIALSISFAGCTLFSRQNAKTPNAQPQTAQYPTSAYPAGYNPAGYTAQQYPQYTQQQQGYYPQTQAQPQYQTQSPYLQPGSASTYPQQQTVQPGSSDPNVRKDGGGYFLQQGELHSAMDGSKISRVFYFKLDSDVPQPEDAPRLMAHSRFIQARPDVKVRIEGHGDVRGSREYNLALGDRRARSVANELLKLGVSNSQVVSYGEEKPVTGTNKEESWRKSRRVELFY
jgi:peptidoglycan-associated lipoprotein